MVIILYPKHESCPKSALFKNCHAPNAVSFSDGKKILTSFKTKLPLMCSLIEDKLLASSLAVPTHTRESALPDLVSSSQEGGVGDMGMVTVVTLLFLFTLTSPADLTGRLWTQPHRLHSGGRLIPQSEM